MSGDQKVIVADRATDPLQFGGDLRKLLRYRFELRENLGQRALPLHRLDDKTVVLSVEDDRLAALRKQCRHHPLHDRDQHRGAYHHRQDPPGLGVQFLAHVSDLVA